MTSHAQSGVTEATWRNMILDAAVVYLNYGEDDEVILGATNGGTSFGWAEFETRSPEIDGLKGPIKGATRIIRAVPQIVVNLVEWKLDALKYAFPGVTITEVGGIATITRTKRLMTDADYPTNLAMVGTQSGTGLPVVIMLTNPLVAEGTEIPTEQNSEATATVTFHGHYDPANPELEPWSIRWPIPAEEGAPEAFVLADWSVADDETSGDITITIASLPENGGSAITDIEYRLDNGAATSLAGATATTYAITGLTDDQAYSVQIRAVNATGEGPWSDIKTVTPTDGV